MQITVNINDEHKARVEAAFKANFPSIERGIESFVISYVARFEQAQKQAEIQQQPDNSIIEQDVLTAATDATGAAAAVDTIATDTANVS